MLFRATVSVPSSPCTRGRESWCQPEGWVLVCDQHHRVANHPIVPADDPRDEVEESLRVPPGKENREPGDEHDHDRGDLQKGQDYEVGNRQEPFHQGQPSIEILWDIRVWVVQ